MLKSMFGVPLSDLHGKCLSRLEFQFTHPKLAKKNTYILEFFSLRQIFEEMQKEL